MKTKWHFLLLAGALLAVNAGAEVYKSVDEAGNVIYSDEPSPGAEVINLPEIQIFTSPPTPESTYTPPKTAAAPYTRLEILSPAHDEALRQNDGNITVSVAIEPALRGSDRLALYLDGQPIASGSQTSFDLENVDRGTHQVHAVVTGPDGQARMSSPAVIFHLQRHSALHPNPGQAPANPPKN